MSKHLADHRTAPSGGRVKAFVTIARRGSGQVWQARAPAEGVPMGLRDGLDFADGVYTDLWSRPEVLLWLVALMGLEWALRRRWGLA